MLLVRSIVIAGLALTAANSAGGQVFQGVAIEDSSRKPIARFPVSLLRLYSAFQAVVAKTTTDAQGLFQMSAREAGIYRLEFGDSLAAITYGPVDTVARDSVIFRQYAVRAATNLSRRALLEWEVEEPVKLVSKTAPVYPRQLREHGVCGEVLAHYVVDTLGRADMESFRIVRSSDSLFSKAVRDGVALFQFEPARIHGRRAAQLVRQPFTFTIISGIGRTLPSREAFEKGLTSQSFANPLPTEFPSPTCAPLK